MISISGDKTVIVERSKFQKLFDDAGISHPLLRQKLWEYICSGEPSKESVTIFEIVKSLNSILRGTLIDVASMFFALYDVNNEGIVTIEGVKMFYSAMLCKDYESSNRSKLVSGRSDHKTSFSQNIISSFQANSTMRMTSRSSQFSRSLARSISSISSASYSLSSDRIYQGRLSLSDIEQENLINWIDSAKAYNSGILDKKAFVRSILKTGTRSPSDTIGKRSCFYLLFLFWFEVGGTFASLALALLPDQFKQGFDITEKDIGLINSVFFVSGVLSPPVGGALLHILGSTKLHVGASVVVTFGAVVQWISFLQRHYILLICARFIIGFGLEICFLTTIEIYLKIFPRHIGFMLGLHSLRGALIYFIASIFMRKITTVIGIEHTLALLVAFCIVTTIASIIVDVSCKKEETMKITKNDKSNSQHQEKVVELFASLADALAPSIPKGRSRCRFPAPFYFAILGNKAINYFLNTFSVFAVELYARNFHGVSYDYAASAMGVTAVIGGILAISCGFLMDRYGNRSLLLCAATFIGMVGFLVLQWSNRSIYLWIASICFAITISFADLAIVTIPLLVHRSQVGIAYGIYGLVGNSLDTLLSLSSGWLMSRNKEDMYLQLCSTFMLIGCFSWLIVFHLGKNQTFIEKPTKSIIHTSREDICLASMVDIANQTYSTPSFTEGSNSTKSLKRDRCAKVKVTAIDMFGEDN